MKEYKKFHLFKVIIVVNKDPSC